MQFDVELYGRTFSGSGEHSNIVRDIMDGTLGVRIDFQSDCDTHRSGIVLTLDEAKELVKQIQISLVEATDHEEFLKKLKEEPKSQTQRH